MVPPRILLALPEEGDRHLASLLLTQAFPDAPLVAVGDALAFAEALVAGFPTVVIVGLDLGWTSGLEMVRALKRQRAGLVAILFAPSVPESVVAGGLFDLVEGVVRASSAGFVELPGVVRRALARSAERAPVPLPAEPPPRIRAGEPPARSPAGLFSLAADGTVVHANPAFARVLGLAADPTAVALTAGEAFAGVDPPVPWESILGEDGQAWEGTVRLPRPDGAVFRLRLDLWPARDGSGRVRSVNGSVEDLGREEAIVAHESAAAPQEDTGELEELEELTYAVSHDLQEPLHVITRNARLLAETCTERLGKDGERFLTRLSSSAQRMQQMLDGLLECAQAGSGEEPLTSLDFTVALEEALASLRGRIDEAGGEVSYGPLPQLPADRQQIVHLFQNLIGNAVKFRGPEPPRVVVSARERERDWRFAVRDNGIGIDPRFHERIFGMFQRLHTAEEYPGTGIGLALCKRIVERHGGSIWVHSAPGEGATFYFTIAKTPAGDATTTDAGP
jgi:signal transduction histidine kinase